MKITIAACLGVAVITYGVANAQSSRDTETGSRIVIPKRARIPDDSTLSKSELSRKVLNEFARCAINRNYPAVASAVSKPMGAGFHEAIARVVSADCLYSGMISFKAVALRGPLFVELYKRRELAKSQGRVWGPVTPSIDFSAPSSLESDAHRAILDVATCAIDANPNVARAVVLEHMMSEAQDNAFAAIVPALGACLPEGKTLSLTKQVIEGMLAEVLYRGVKPAPTTDKAVN